MSDYNLKSSNRIFGLDLLKILACLAVIILHTMSMMSMTDDTYILKNLLYYSSCFAVPIFFMVNGYFLLNKSSLTYNYIFKKIINICIVILSFNMLIYLLSLLKKEPLDNPICLSIDNILQKDFFFHFWFLGSLMIIYLILPYLNKLFKNTKRAVILTFIFILISITIDMLNLIRTTHGTAIIHINIIETFRLWTWISYYLLGGLLGNNKIKTYLLSKISNKNNLLLFIACTIAVNFYQYYISKNLYNTVSGEYFYDNFISFIWNSSLFLLLLRQSYSAKFYNPLFDLISKNVMGIYVLHIPIMKIFFKIYSFQPIVSTLIFIVMVFAASLSVSVIISRLPFFNRIIKI